MPKASFNKSNVKEFTAEKRVASGKHAFLIVDAEQHESENNDNVMQKLSLKILTDPEDANSVAGFSTRTYVTLPLDNSDVSGHSAPDWSGRTANEIISAAFEDVPAFPRKIKGGKVLYNGGEIDADDFNSAKEEAMIATGEKSEELNENPTAWNGQRIYADLSYDENGWPRLRHACTEPPADWEISYETMEIVGGKSNGALKSGSKKTAKKVTKKRGRR